MRLYCTENPGWGFHGEMARIGVDAAEAFDQAARQIATATHGDGFKAALFLDSRQGRHFGDSVANYIDSLPLDKAIHAAVGRWIDWKALDRLMESVVC